MDGLVIAAISVGALCALALLGALASRQERLSAPDQLALARSAFDQGQHQETLRLLDGAFYQPLDDRYRPGDAEVALQAVTLLARVLEELGADADAVVSELREALGEASRHGGLVPRRLTNPVKTLLGRAGADAVLAEQLVREIRTRSGQAAGASEE